LVEDIACQENNQNTPDDEIFFEGGCQSVRTICEGVANMNLVGVNARFCANATQQIPIGNVIKRVLSSEEFF
jgi:hypothetical protein